MRLPNTLNLHPSLLFRFTCAYVIHASYVTARVALTLGKETPTRSITLKGKEASRCAQRCMRAPRMHTVVVMITPTVVDAPRAYSSHSTYSKLHHTPSSNS